MSPRANRTVVPASGEDRRFRRTPVSPRRKTTRALRWSWILARRGLVATVVVAGLLGAGYEVVGSSAFHVQHVTVRGNRRLASGEVLALMAGLRGQHILRTNLDEWRTRLLGSPWVADARLRRVLPSTIDVAVAERVPLAIARIDGQLLLIDMQGLAIDEYGPQHTDMDLPIVDGFPTEPAYPQAIVQARAALVDAVLQSLRNRPELLQRLSQIDVGEPHDVVVILEGDVTRVHLGETAFAERLQTYLDLAPALQSRIEAVDYVDLRFQPRIFVKPALLKQKSDGPSPDAKDAGSQ